MDNCLRCRCPKDRSDRKLCAACRTSQRKANSKWQKINHQKTREYTTRYRKRIRQQVVSHYGGRCTCCGESNIAFLTIDHMNGDGAEHRRQLGSVGKGGAPFFAWLKRNNYPDIFQVLCWNCNIGKGQSKICPHKEE